MSGQHNPIFLLRIRTVLLQRHLTVEFQIIVAGCSQHGKHLIPPRIDFRNLGEKAMAAHIHPVSFIFYCTGNASETVALFENHDFDVISFL